MTDFPANEPGTPRDSGTPRPLPRRPAPRPAPAARASRPKFQTLDGLWMLALCLLSIGVSCWLGDLTGRRLAASLLAAGTVAALYALGWRARDRAAGVSAGLLAVASPFLSLAAYSPQSAALTLLSVCALLAFVAGSSLVALALAAGAAMVRPDGLALGILLLGLSLAQRRKHALLGGAVLLLPITAFEAGRVLLGHGLPRLPVWGLHWDVWRWLGAPATLLLCWLLVPLCGEWSEAARRARWLPVVLWAMLSLALASGEETTAPHGMLLPLMPLLAALAGGGLSRLLPNLAGDSPRPLVRYALATAAVLGMALVYLRLEAAFSRPVVIESPYSR